MCVCVCVVCVYTKHCDSKRGVSVLFLGEVGEVDHSVVVKWWKIIYPMGIKGLFLLYLAGISLLLVGMMNGEYSRSHTVCK